MSPVGRPKSENPKQTRFSIRLDTETEKKLEEYCRKRNVSKGEAIRRGIELILREE